jgi:anti-sigma regulatory factor (Ser/Thr protein kinase)
MTAAACTEITRRAFKITLPAVPTAVAYARSLVSSTLGRWSVPHLIDTAELLTSELATNAITATVATDGGDTGIIQLRIAMVDVSLLVGVWDCDPAPPAPQEPDDNAEGGRGLMLVEALAKQWGTRPSRRGGKVVWFEMDAARPATGRGLPIRTPTGIPRQRPYRQEIDVALLGRVLMRLRCLS